MRAHSIGERASDLAARVIEARRPKRLPASTRLARTAGAPGVGTAAWTVPREAPVPARAPAAAAPAPVVRTPSPAASLPGVSEEASAWLAGGPLPPRLVPFLGTPMFPDEQQAAPVPGPDGMSTEAGAWLARGELPAALAPLPEVAGGDARAVDASSDGSDLASPAAEAAGPAIRSASSGAEDSSRAGAPARLASPPTPSRVALQPGRVWGRVTELPPADRPDLPAVARVHAVPGASAAASQASESAPGHGVSSAAAEEPAGGDRAVVAPSETPPRVAEEPSRAPQTEPGRPAASAADAAAGAATSATVRRAAPPGDQRSRVQPAPARMAETAGRMARGARGVLARAVDEADRRRAAGRASAPATDGDSPPRAGRLPDPGRASESETPTTASPRPGEVERAARAVDAQVPAGLLARTASQTPATHVPRGAARPAADTAALAQPRTHEPAEDAAARPPSFPAAAEIAAQGAGDAGSPPADVARTAGEPRAVAADVGGVAGESGAVAADVGGVAGEPRAVAPHVGDVASESVPSAAAVSRTSGEPAARELPAEQLASQAPLTPEAVRAAEHPGATLTNADAGADTADVRSGAVLARGVAEEGMAAAGDLVDGPARDAAPPGEPGDAVSGASGGAVSSDARPLDSPRAAGLARSVGTRPARGAGAGAGAAGSVVPEAGDPRVGRVDGAAHARPNLAPVPVGAREVAVQAVLSRAQQSRSRPAPMRVAETAGRLARSARGAIARAVDDVGRRRPTGRGTVSEAAARAVAPRDDAPGEPAVAARSRAHTPVARGSEASPPDSFLAGATALDVEERPAAVHAAPRADVLRAAGGEAPPAPDGASQMAPPGVAAADAQAAPALSDTPTATPPALTSSPAGTAQVLARAKAVPASSDARAATPPTLTSSPAATAPALARVEAVPASSDPPAATPRGLTSSPAGTAPAPARAEAGAASPRGRASDQSATALAAPARTSTDATRAAPMLAGSADESEPAPVPGPAPAATQKLLPARPTAEAATSARAREAAATVVTTTTRSGVEAVRAGIAAATAGGGRRVRLARVPGAAEAAAPNGAQERRVAAPAGQGAESRGAAVAPERRLAAAEPPSVAAPATASSEPAAEAPSGGVPSEDRRQVPPDLRAPDAHEILAPSRDARQAAPHGEAAELAGRDGSGDTPEASHGQQAAAMIAALPRAVAALRSPAAASRTVDFSAGGRLPFGPLGPERLSATADAAARPAGGPAGRPAFGDGDDPARDDRGDVPDADIGSLYERLAARLRADLLDDRERRGDLLGRRLR